MATAKTIAVTFVGISFLILSLAIQILGSSPAPAPGPGGSSDVDCFPYLLNVSDCLTFVEKGSNLTAPEKGCCPELSRLVGTQPICLCQLIGNSSASVGIDIDVEKALKLPDLCSVKAPSISYCAVAGYPISPPSPNEAPGVNPTPPAAAAEGETPKAGNKNGGSSSRSIENLLSQLIALFVGIFVFGLF